jgi:hypothetical protein
MASSKATHPVLYRVSQFFAAVKASLPAWAGGVRGDLTAADKALLASILPAPAQQRLFAGMPPHDQRHAIAVARTLQQAGYSQPALMQAALLHDAGKSIGQPIIHRVLIVLFEAFWPAALQCLSTPGEKVNEQMDEWLKGTSPFSLQNWRRPFVVHAQHPAIGAAWAEDAACEALAVSLIARHAEPAGAEEKLLAALQWADDLN